MPQEHLQALQAHPGIEKLCCKGMAKRVDRVAPMIQPRLLDIVHEPAPGRAVAHRASLAAAVEQVLLQDVSLSHPALQSRKRVIAEVHHSTQPVLLPFVDLDAALSEVHIHDPGLQ